MENHKNTKGHQKIEAVIRSLLKTNLKNNVILFNPSQPWKRIEIYKDILQVSVFAQNIDGIEEECISESIFDQQQELYDYLTREVLWLTDEVTDIRCISVELF